MLKFAEFVFSKFRISCLLRALKFKYFFSIFNHKESAENAMSQQQILSKSVIQFEPHFHTITRSGRSHFQRKKYCILVVYFECVMLLII